ncbi:MAG: TRAP transporter permease DctQ [Rhodobacterales bacterium]|nr:MAG: TRAP transporter permease DctQ [Rhodobacterales bacterium]
MSGEIPEISGDVIAISDPGERDRQSHLKGDRIVIAFGNLVAWAFPILMLAIVSQVILRKAGFNQAWLDDAQWWIYGFAMVTGFAYAITTNSHVRVDIFHANYSPARKARIECFGLGWLLLPFLIMMTDVLFHYAWSSVLAREGSDSPNGLHGLYILKASLPLLFGLAILATVSILMRHLVQLAPVRLWTLLVAMLPGAIFAAERTIYYVLWWGVRLTNAGIKPKRISKEPIFEWTTWMGAAVVLTLILLGWLMARRKGAEE